MNPKEIEIVMLGNSGVGKTSIIERFCKGDFDSNAQSTVGYGCKKKKIDVNDQEVQLTIWDTAGQEKYKSCAPTAVKRANVCILVADVQSRGSFSDINEWKKIVDDNNSSAVIIFAINKVDLNPNLQNAVKGVSDSDNQLVVERDDFLDDIKYLCNSYPYNFWVSALNGKDIDLLFQTATELALDNNALSQKSTYLKINNGESGRKCCV